jgi:hypothetical protein
MREHLTTTAIAALPSGRLGWRAVSLRARVRQERLEDALAAGADPWSSAELVRCASRLTSPEARHRFAAALDGLITLVEYHGCAIPIVPVRRNAVLAERRTLDEIRVRLHDPAPITVVGLARIAQLLRPSSSPLFDPERNEADATLRAVLARCHQAVFASCAAA